MREGGRGAEGILLANKFATSLKKNGDIAVIVNIYVNALCRQGKITVANMDPVCQSAEWNRILFC